MGHGDRSIREPRAFNVNLLQLSNSVPHQTPKSGRLSGVVLAPSEILYRLSGDGDALLELRSGGRLHPVTVTGRGWLQRYVHPEDHEAVTGAIARAARGRTICRLQYRIRQADGTFALFKSRAVPVMDDAGDVVEWLGMGEAAAEAHASKAALLAGNESVRPFLATLAHELRNPLAAIQLSIDLLRHQHQRDGAGEGTWAVLERQVAHLSALVQDVFDVARVEAGGLILRKTRLTLQKIMQQAMDIVMPVADQRGQTVSVSMPGEPLWLEADGVRLAQVIANLVHNACKFTAEGGQIAIRADAAEGAVGLSVSDNGIGIPAESLPHVFDLFWKGGGQGEDEGLGIGLTLVGSLIRMHGGTVEVRSPGPGQGSTFLVTLPLAGEASEREAARAHDPGVETAHRVLVVDDDRGLLDVVATTTDQLGLDVLTANDPWQVLNLMAWFRPTMVVLALDMAPLDGCQVAHMIRQERDYDAVTLVALTALSGDRDLKRAAQSGFTQILVEPLTAPKLQKLLSSIPVPEL